MFTRNLVVLPSNAAKDGTIKLRSLLDYFQDTATLAVNDVEGIPTQLYAKGYAWVLTRYEIEFTGPLPALDDEFTINTYHDPNHAYNCLRVFDVTSGVSMLCGQNLRGCCWTWPRADQLSLSLTLRV